MHARAQDPDLLKSRILTAIRRSALIAPTIKSYRIDGSITVSDGAGRNSQQGSFAILRRDKYFRITVVFQSSSTTVLTTPDGTYTASHGDLPYYAAPIVLDLEQPVDFKGFDSSAASRPGHLPSDEALDCATLVNTKEAVIRGPSVPEHAICLATANDDLRVVVDGNNVFIRDDQASFGDQRISRDVQLQIGGITVAELKVQRMENAVLEDREFLVSSEMTRVKDMPTRIPGSVIAGKILKHDSPKYPGVARAAHIQGIVVLHAIIGKDGHIENLSVISSPDATLTEASIKSVKNWTYEPYLLNGVPTEVDTTITVNFAIGK